MKAPPVFWLPPLVVASAVLAQAEMPVSPVRFTEAVQHEVRRGVQLPGSVDSLATSQVAAEVEGAVRRLDAREGDSVRRGDPLVSLDTTNLELRLKQIDGQLKEARARLELAVSNYERNKELRESGVISERDYDDAFSELSAWEGRIDALTAGSDRVRVDLQRSVIRAPFDSAVVQERTDVGQWVNSGQAVADVVALDRLEVRVDVNERVFASIRPGTRATVRFESMPDLVLDGEVTAVIPRADPQARTFPVKVRIPNESGRIGVGMLAQVGLPIGESYEATLVPKDALVAEGPRRVVYKINGDSTVVPVEVRVGAGHGSWSIVEGLEPGARVVTRGNERLIPGQIVEGTPLEYALP